jgi:hypothetical protein
MSKFFGIIFSGIFIILVVTYLIGRSKLKNSFKFESGDMPIFEVNKYLKIFDLSGLVFLTIFFVLSAVFLLLSSNSIFKVNDYLFWIQVVVILYILQINSFEQFKSFFQISETDLKWNLKRGNKNNDTIIVRKNDIQEILRDKKGSIIIKLNSGTMHKIKNKELELLGGYAVLSEKLLHYL